LCIRELIEGNPTDRAYGDTHICVTDTSYKSKWNRDIAAFVPTSARAFFVFLEQIPHFLHRNNKNSLKFP
jgi:hypothetical protein